MFQQLTIWYRISRVYIDQKKASACFLKFNDYLKRRIRKVDIPSLKSPLTVKDLKSAEDELIKYEQRVDFGSWMKQLSCNNAPNGHSRSSPLFTLKPTLVEGMLRVGGRLDRAPVAYPVILPHLSHLTFLVIEFLHVLTGHSGLNGTLNSLAQRFWIVKGNTDVRRVLRDCVLCRRRDVKPGEQIMADLPVERLKMRAHPFAYSGVDYFGPMLIRQGRSSVKRYTCWFTCLTTRAIHLGVAGDLTNDAFINALRRFISRRGEVVHIYSDNGTNFVGEERILREAIQTWNHRKIENFLQQREIQWSFNPPTASHMGGARERMASSVHILVSLSRERTLTDDQQHTLLLEAETTLNSRPLTPVTFNEDGKTPLTPNHLVRVSPMTPLPPWPVQRVGLLCHKTLASWTILGRPFLETLVSRISQN